jgi:hypothetical protein
MNRRTGRACPELILLTATLISAVNALVALGLVHLASVHLAVVNIALASVLGVVARGLVPAEPPNATPADGRAHHPEGGST